MNALGSWMGQLLNGGSGSPIVKREDNSGGNDKNASGSGGGGDNNTNGKGKEGNNADPLDKLWVDPATGGSGDGKGKDGKGGKGDEGGNNNNNNNNVDPQKAVSDFLQAQGLGDIKLSDAEITQLKSGEGFQEVVSSLNSRIQNGFIKAMSNAANLMDAKIEKAIEKMQADSRGYYQGEQLRSLIREKIPAAKDPVIGPVAETIVQRMLKQGATIDQAMEGTKKFFERSAKAFGFSQNNVNTNTRGSYGSGSNRANGDNSQGGDNNEEGELNWMELLKG